MQVLAGLAWCSAESVIAAGGPTAHEEDRRLYTDSSFPRKMPETQTGACPRYGTNPKNSWLLVAYDILDHEMSRYIKVTFPTKRPHASTR